MLLDLFSALRRRLLLVLLSFMLLAAGAVAGAYTLDQTYEVRAKLLVGFDARPVSVSRAELPSEGPGLLTVEAVTTLTEILNAEDAVEEVVDALGPDTFKGEPPSNPLVRAVAETIQSASGTVKDWLASAGLIAPVDPRQALIDEVAANISVFPVRQSQVVEIAFSWTVPDVPPLVMARLLDIYEDRINAFNAQAAEEGILADEAAGARERLGAAQKRLASLQDETGLIDPSLKREVLMARIEALEPVLRAGEDGLGATVSESGIVKDLSDLSRRLADLRIERAGALVEFTSDNPRIRALDAMIAQAEKQVAVDRRRAQDALEADRSDLEHALATENAFANAREEVALAAEAFRTYSQAANDRRVMRVGQEEVRMRVIEHPSAVAHPSGPSRLTSLLLGLAVSLILACGLGLLVDRLRRGAVIGYPRRSGRHPAQQPADEGPPYVRRAS